MTTTPLHYTHYTAWPLLHCAILTTLHDHYSMACHCTATPLLHWISLHCIHYTAPLCSTAVRRTASPPLNWISLLCIQYSASPLLRCTALTTPHRHYSTAFHYTPTILHSTVQGATKHFISTPFHCTLLHGTHCIVFQQTLLHGALYTVLYFTTLNSQALQFTVCSVTQFTVFHCTSLHGAVLYTAL